MNGWRAGPGGLQVGRGEPDLVLLPGIAGDPLEFARLAPYLGARTGRALALPDVEDTDLAAIAAHLERFLPERPVVVVGASFGALVARAWDPARISRLLTIGALPRWSPAARRAGWVGTAIGALPDALYRTWYRRRSRAAWAEDDADDALIEAIRLPEKRVLAARLKAIARWGLPSRLPPGTACLWGATDRFVGWTEADVVAAGGEPVVVPGNHRPHVAHPAEVARWV